MSQQNQSTQCKFLRLQSVSDKTSIGKSTILAWEATGKFPRAIRLSPTMRVWLEETVEHWMLGQAQKESNDTDASEIRA